MSVWDRLWALSEGGNRYGLRQKRTGCRGVYTTKAIPAGVRIMEIPWKHIITTDSMYRSNPLLKHIYPRQAEENNRFIFHLYSIFTGRVVPLPWEEQYLASLPSDVSHFCLFFDKTMLNPLRGTCYSRVPKPPDSQPPSSLFDSIESYQQYYDHDMARLGIPPENTNLYKKSAVLVNSRIFSFLVPSRETRVGKPPQTTRVGMVPLADLLNHGSETSNTVWYFDAKKNVFVVQTSRPIPKNAEVLDSYGDKNDVRWLYTYGFYMPQNPYGELRIPSRSGDMIVPRRGAFTPTAAEKHLLRRYRDRLRARLRTMPSPHPFHLVFTCELSRAEDLIGRGGPYFSLYNSTNSQP